MSTRSVSIFGRRERRWAKVCGDLRKNWKYLDKFIEAFGISEEEKEIFEDLAAATRGYTYEDINPILGGQPLAREALRKFKEARIPEDKCDELWLTFMKEFDRIAEEQLQLLKKTSNLKYTE